MAGSKLLFMDEFGRISTGIWGKRIPLNFQSSIEAIVSDK